MAISPLKQKRKQQYLIFAFVAIIIVTFFVLWKGFFSGEGEKGKGGSVSEASPPRQVKINFELLESSAVKELQPFEKVPPLEELEGRENPFVPSF